MARIMDVDYEAIPSQAKQMRQQGKDLNSEIVKAYNNVAQMHSFWYGKRYNALVAEFNAIIPQVNDLLELVVRDIPFTLETIANNYSQADQGSNVTVATQESASKVADIALSTEVGMKFLTDKVTEAQTNVSNNFNHAKDKMNEIESTFTKINWNSEAAEAFRAKFKKLKENVIKSFENINDQFIKLMNQAKEDVQAAESQNTVN